MILLLEQGGILPKDCFIHVSTNRVFGRVVGEVECHVEFCTEKCKIQKCKIHRKTCNYHSRVMTGNKVISYLCYVLSQTPLINEKYIQTEMEMKLLLNESF